MVGMFGAVFLFAVVALGIGGTRFWREQGQSYDRELAAGAKLEAARDVLTLKYLDGGHGDGCNNEDDRFSLWRRRMHHFTFYGFMLCFAATSVATLYHYLLDWHAPYPRVPPEEIRRTSRLIAHAGFGASSDDPDSST